MTRQGLRFSLKDRTFQVVVYYMGFCFVFIDQKSINALELDDQSTHYVNYKHKPY